MRLTLPDAHLRGRVCVRCQLCDHLGMWGCTGQVQAFGDVSYLNGCATEVPWARALQPVFAG